MVRKINRRKFFGMKELFYILIVMVVTQLYTFAKTATLTLNAEKLS